MPRVDDSRERRAWAERPIPFQPAARNNPATHRIQWRLAGGHLSILGGPAGGERLLLSVPLRGSA